MNAELLQEGLQAPTEDRKGRNKRRRLSKSGLRDFTSRTRRTKKGKNAIRGWSVEGKRYVFAMMKKLSDEEQSGVRVKWEMMYQKLCEVAREEDRGSEESKEETFEMDEAMLYAEV